MRNLTLTTEDLRCLIAASIRIYENGKNAPLNKGVKISKNTAEKLYGYPAVSRWIKEGKVKPVRVGTGRTSTLNIPLSEIQKALEEEELDRIIVKEQIV